MLYKVIEYFALLPMSVSLFSFNVNPFSTMYVQFYKDLMRGTVSIPAYISSNYVITVQVLINDLDRCRPLYFVLIFLFVLTSICLHDVLHERFVATVIPAQMLQLVHDTSKICRQGYRIKR